MNAAIRPVRPATPPGFGARRRDAAFTADSALEQMIVRMISLNSLAAFAAEVIQTRPGTAEPGAGTAARVQPAAAGNASAGRGLAAVPAAPDRPLPRGSLLDLRV